MIIEYESAEKDGSIVMENVQNVPKRIQSPMVILIYSSKEEQNKRLVESLERLSQAWRSMGQTVDALCESMEKLHETIGKEDGDGNE